jgi:hypothetical protein
MKSYPPMLAWRDWHKAAKDKVMNYQKEARSRPGMVMCAYNSNHLGGRD